MQLLNYELLDWFTINSTKIYARKVYVSFLPLLDASSFDNSEYILLY